MTIRKPLLAVAAAAVLAAPATIATAQDNRAHAKGAAELAKLLDGRVAGEPERCVRTFPSRNVEIIDGTALVIRAGSTVWVNTTQDPDRLDEDDALLIRKFGNVSQLCRLDQVTTFDRFNGFYTGNVFLTDFVPYRKADASS
jgi:hypothetical protein